MIRLFGYLMNYNKGMLVIHPSLPAIRNEATVSSGHNWSEFYPDACEDIPPDMLTPKGRMAHLTCFVDADHADEFINHAAAHLEEKGITGWQTEILRADSNGARIVIE